MNMMKLYDWWKDRAIPITRHGLDEFQQGYLESLLTN